MGEASIKLVRIVRSPKESNMEVFLGIRLGIWGYSQENISDFHIVLCLAFGKTSFKVDIALWASLPQIGFSSLSADKEEPP